ncbi:hypothetical protein M2352_001265 [Azospirillum fermentarium]|uniref:DUF2087 domain-containing protein n=1 Tax=Azospirillum fermentarium TaxID=1233114 RepID=UPI0022264317|nr:DUF2087 domain-containing protein [Azospirillum fermentarium]MCW2245674.1 hypothetical protein [Azospirillum fermentarium]
MTRTPLPYRTDDISALARSLRIQLAGRSETPSHVELLNMLAKAAGHRNFQHFRSLAVPAPLPAEAPPPAASPPETPPEPAAVPAAVDMAKILRIARCFNDAGVLVRWPPKLSERQPCLWVMWSRVPPGAVLHERAVNALLQDNHSFGDHALLRRDMCDMGLLVRTPDGREYRRVEQPPPAGALALIRHLKTRSLQNARRT